MTNEQADQLIETLQGINESLMAIANGLVACKAATDVGFVHLGGIHEKMLVQLDGIQDNVLYVANSTHDVQERLGSLCIIQESEHICR